MRRFAHLYWMPAMLFTWLWVPVVGASGQCTGGYAASWGDTCFDDYDHLMDHMQDTERRERPFRMVRPRQGRDTAESPHNQFYNSCFFYSTAPILEYLGYSRFEAGSSFEQDFYYVDSDSFEIYENFDVGYHNSPEHLMSTFLTYEALNRGYSYEYNWPYGWTFETHPEIYWCGFFEDDDCGDLDNSPRTDLNTGSMPCGTVLGDYWIYEAGEEYGVCPTLGDSYEWWLNEVQLGCGGDCDCTQDADCGMYWFLNEVMVGDARQGGCNDARPIDPGSSTDRNHARKIIRAFVDNNVPLLITVQDGGHFMTLVGYEGLTFSGLPQFAILADPVRKVLWRADLTQWDGTERWSINAIMPWNHHLDGGCDAGGWASELDATLPGHLDICTEPAGWTNSCIDRTFGTQVSFFDNNYAVGRYQVFPGDTFVTEDTSLDADRVTVVHADPDVHVTDAQIRRYWFDESDDRWEGGTTYDADDIDYYSIGSGRTGIETHVTFDAVWPDDYWFVAQGLSWPYTQRRVKIELDLSDGSVQTIEVAPPETYGLTVEFDDNGTVRSYFSPPAANLTDIDGEPGLQQVYENYDRDADEVRLFVALGVDVDVDDAEIQRYYWGIYDEWLPLNSAWFADDVDFTSRGLTGTEVEFTWDISWIDDYWFAGDYIGSGATYGDRLTVIRLLDSHGDVIRELEVAPH